MESRNQYFRVSSDDCNEHPRPTDAKPSLNCQQHQCEHTFLCTNLERKLGTCSLVSEWYCIQEKQTNTQKSLKRNFNICVCIKIIKEKLNSFLKKNLLQYIFPLLCILSHSKTFSSVFRHLLTFSLLTLLPSAFLVFYFLSASFIFIPHHFLLLSILLSRLTTVVWRNLSSLGGIQNGKNWADSSRLVWWAGLKDNCNTPILPLLVFPPVFCQSSSLSFQKLWCIILFPKRVLVLFCFPLPGASREACRSFKMKPPDSISVPPQILSLKTWFPGKQTVQN